MPRDLATVARRLRDAPSTPLRDRQLAVAVLHRLHHRLAIAGDDLVQLQRADAALVRDARAFLRGA